MCSDGSNTILSNIERTRTSFFQHQTNSNVFICWRSNSNTLFFASDERTSNLIGHSLDLLNYSSNRLEHHFLEHLMNSNIIELQHPIFGFDQYCENYKNILSHILNKDEIVSLVLNNKDLLGSSWIRYILQFLFLKAQHWK